MAQIEKRGNKYRVRIFYKDEFGNKKSHSKSGFRSKPEAREYAKIAEANLNEIIKTDHNIILTEYVEDYIEKFIVPSYSASTIDSNYYALDKIKDYYDTKLLKNVTFSDYQLFIDNLIKHPYSTSTIKKCHGLMSKAMITAHRDGLIKQNFTEYVEMKYKEVNMPKEKKYLPLEDIKPFLEHVRNRSTIQYYLFRLIIETGLRVGEACALTYEDIDTENNTLNVTKSYDQKRKVLGPTKTGNNRIVHITQSLAKEISNLIQIQKAFKVVNEKVYNNKHNFIFVDELGNPIPRSTIHNTMVHITERMYGEGNHLSIHELRHTHASLLFQADVPLKAISSRLGHKDTNVTERVYTHLTDKYHEQALHDFENYIKDVF